MYSLKHQVGGLDNIRMIMNKIEKNLWNNIIFREILVLITHSKFTYEKSFSRYESTRNNC